MNNLCDMNVIRGNMRWRSWGQGGYIKTDVILEEVTIIVFREAFKLQSFSQIRRIGICFLSGTSLLLMEYRDNEGDSGLSEFARCVLSVKI